MQHCWISAGRFHRESKIRRRIPLFSILPDLLPYSARRKRSRAGLPKVQRASGSSRKLPPLPTLMPPFLRRGLSLESPLFLAAKKRP